MSNHLTLPSSFPIKNGICFEKTSVKEEKKKCNINLEEIFAVLPQVTNIEKILDKNLYKLLSDDNISKIANVFNKVIKLNKNCFLNTSKEETADILFDCYRDNVLAWMQTNEEYEKSVLKLKKLNGIKSFSSNQIQLSLDKYLRERMKTLFSSVIEFALAESLNVKLNTISLHTYPDTYKFRNLDSKFMQKFFNEV